MADLTNQANKIFDGVFTLTKEDPVKGDLTYVVAPFPFEDKEGAKRAAQAFQNARDAGLRVTWRQWQFEYLGRNPTLEDFAPGWGTPRC